jgi:hypothetical protein
MKESMSFPEPAPQIPTPEQPTAVMEKASNERFDILKNYFARTAEKVLDAIPEQIKKPAIAGLKSTALGHLRMAQQAIGGKNAEGAAISNTERIVKAMSSFTWAINTALTAYYSAEGNWEAVAIVQGANTGIMPINAFLNNEKEVHEAFEKLKEKIPSLGKIKQLVEMPAVELSHLSY